jgi:hypothetical protein
MDQSFPAWLAGNGQRLVALTLTSAAASSKRSTIMVLEALADSAAAAQAAGRPFPLHTLRVLGATVYTQTAGRLLPALPQLRCLQLDMSGQRWGKTLEGGRSKLLRELGSLHQATQLRELYLEGPGCYMGINTDVARLMPLSLRRLSWRTLGFFSWAPGNLSHLTQLTFLQLWSERLRDLQTSHLPPALQQLELSDRFTGVDINVRVVEEQRQVVTAWRMQNSQDRYTQQLLARQPNLSMIEVYASDLRADATRAAMEQLTHLSALKVVAYGCCGVPQALATAASLPSLQRLHLEMLGVPEPNGLPALQQVTQLRLAMNACLCSTGQQLAWGNAVGRLAGLHWLSVPAVLLAAGQAWLGGLQQLRVLVLHCKSEDVVTIQHLSSMSWAEVLPPQVQWLGVGGVTAEQAADLQLRRRLQQALGSSGCEVVVGVDLDEAADPTQQLAGLPEGLQQVLA